MPIFWSLIYTTVDGSFLQGSGTEASADSLAVSMMDGLDANKDHKISMDELAYTLELAKPEEGDDEEGDDATPEWQNWLKGFNEADANKDLLLTTGELTYLLEHVSKQDAQKLFDDSLAVVMKGFDTDSDGKVRFKEVIHKSDMLKSDQATRAKLMNKFLASDANKDKSLDQKELGHLLKHLSKKDAEALFNPLEHIHKTFDTDKDGSMSVDELSAMLAQGIEQTGEDETKHELRDLLDGLKNADNKDKDPELKLKELNELLKHASHLHEESEEL